MRFFIGVRNALVVSIPFWAIIVFVGWILLKDRSRLELIAMLMPVLEIMAILLLVAVVWLLVWHLLKDDEEDIAI